MTLVQWQDYDVKHMQKNRDSANRHQFIPMDISTGATVSVSTASVSMKKGKGKLYRSIKYQPLDYFQNKLSVQVARKVSRGKQVWHKM